MSRIKRRLVLSRTPGEPDVKIHRRKTTLPATTSPARPPSSSPPAAPTISMPGGRRLELRGVRTTGLFPVPGDAQIQLAVFISSFSDADETAAVTVRRLCNGELATVFFRSLTVPARGVQQVAVDGLAGETVAVEVALASDRQVPSAAVTQYFPADGAIVTLVYKSPGDFVPV